MTFTFEQSYNYSAYQESQGNKLQSYEGNTKIEISLR